MRHSSRLLTLAGGLLVLALPAWLWAALPREEIYQPGQLKPVDSQLKVAVGQVAPDFSLPAVSGGRVSLSQYRGKKNVVLSFVPAAWTPVCSEQWPGYNLAREEFEERGTIVLGITTDNLPTLFAWTRAMGGVWFPVLSDFWPHGAVAGQYGVLRGDGTSERALLLIDKAGVLRYIAVQDINIRPDLGVLMGEIDKLR
ncbi:MAG: peroxiredoxin [Desulfarculus sp.]|nr:peroxiredoxin [Desulfarculus sp.]